MFRTSARLSVALVLLLALGAIAAPAALAKRGGKKPVGTVTSWDGTTLQVTLNGGQTVTATVAPDVQVKVEHRGEHSRGKGHGNPSNGSVEDIFVGVSVLRIKLEDGVVTKLRLRRLAGASTEGEASSTDTSASDAGTTGTGADSGSADSGTAGSDTSDAAGDTSTSP